MLGLRFVGIGRMDDNIQFGLAATLMVFYVASMCWLASRGTKSRVAVAVTVSAISIVSTRVFAAILAV